MPDKKINLRFTVTGEEAAKKLKDYAKSLEDIGDKSKRTTPSIKENNLALMNMSRIVQDLPFGFMGIGNNITFMAEQMTRAKAEGQSFSTQLKGMASSMMGTGGLMFAISAVTSLLTYFSMNMKSAKSDTDLFAESIDKAIKKLIDFQDPLKELKFGLSPEELNQIIPAIQKEIDALKQLNEGRKQEVIGTIDPRYQGILGQSLGSQLTSQEKSTRKNQEALIEQLKEIKSQYEAQKTVADMLDKLGLKRVDKEKDVTKSLKEQTKEIEKQITGFSAIIDKTVQLNDPARSPFNSFGRWAGNTRGASTKGGMAMMAGMRTEDIKNQFAEFNVIAQSAADTMRQAFSQAWQDIFGEANSLLEMFLQNIASGLLSLLAESVATSIFSFLTGGVSGLLLKPSTGGDNIINLKIGDDTVEKFVFKGLPGAMNRGIRTRAF
jgi:hypothetical protein